MDRLRNEDVILGAGVERNLSERVNQRALGWYGHMVRIYKERLTNRA